MTNFEALINKIDNPMIRSELVDIKEKWSKLTFATKAEEKSNLEFLLKYNVLEILYINKNNQVEDLIITSSTPLIKSFAASKNELKKTFKLKSEGIKYNKSNMVKTWNLLKNNYSTLNLGISIKDKKYIPLKVIEINEKNIQYLHTLFSNIK